MTADELQRLVRLIGNAGWCRHWLHYNYPQTEPWEMAISCVAIRMSDSGGRRLSDPVVLKDLEVRGFRPEVSTDGLIIYVIARTNEDGTPFRSKGDDDPPLALLPDDAPGSEDAGLAAAQVLLTPRARLELAAELIAPLTPLPSMSLGDCADGLALLRSLGAEVRTELKTIPCGVEGKPEAREFTAHAIGTVIVYAQHTRRATLEDARQLLEK